MSIFIDEMKELIKSGDDETLKTLFVILSDELRERGITESEIYAGQLPCDRQLSAKG